MFELTTEYIQKDIADSSQIFQRGVRLYQEGVYNCTEMDEVHGAFVYEIDGNFGDYTTRVRLLADGVQTACDCPYPGKGCKHTVGVLLDVMHRQNLKKSTQVQSLASVATVDDFLTPDEIRAQAISDRRQEARKEPFTALMGGMLKGERIVETPRKRRYRVTLHDPHTGAGHCSCPDGLSHSSSHSNGYLCQLRCAAIRRTECTVSSLLACFFGLSPNACWNIILKAKWNHKLPWNLQVFDLSC